MRLTCEFDARDALAYICIRPAHNHNLHKLVLDFKILSIKKSLIGIFPHHLANIKLSFYSMSYFIPSNLLFLAVHNSSKGDLVTH